MVGFIVAGSLSSFMSWRPLSLRGETDARFDEPSEGFPVWLRGPVLEWVKAAFLQGSWEHEEARKALQLDFRLGRPLAGQGARGPLKDLLSRMSQNDEFALDVLDWMAHNWRYFASYPDDWTRELNQMLYQGGSVWEVTLDDSTYRLSRRAVGPVVDVLEHTATDATRAHDHLATAWSKLTGRNPDPSGAYREAVRAVEAVAKPVVLPDNNRATLGQMIAAVREKPEKWTVTLGSVDDVRAQMEAFGRGSSIDTAPTMSRSLSVCHRPRQTLRSRSVSTSSASL